MIGYVTLGTKDKDKAEVFYRELLGELGARETFRDDRLVGFGVPGQPVIVVATPFEGEACYGNGTMIAIPAGSQEKVGQLHAKALELGGTDEGEPGERGDDFYGGYVRDLDGNKLVFFHIPVVFDDAKMIGYVTLGAKDKDKAEAFYRELLGELGAQETFRNDRLVGFGVPGKLPSIAVGTPFEGEAHYGNGAMVAIPAGSQEKVGQLYAKALELGGTDEGEPGERIPGFYGGYVRDLDGNKLVFFHMD